MTVLQEPCVTTSRLLAGLHVRDSAGLCEISIEPTEQTEPKLGLSGGKPCWRWHIDLPNGEHHTGDDLAGWGDERAILASLCSFLSACGESYGHSMRAQSVDTDTLDLFPLAVAEWAYSCSGELSMLACELEGGE